MGKFLILVVFLNSFLFPQNIIFIGDSFISGCEVDSVDRFTNIVYDSLRKYQAVNFIKYDYAGQTISEIASHYTDWEKSGIVCVFGGINDIRLGIEFNESSLQSYARIINYFKHDTVLISSITPLSNYAYTLYPPFNKGSKELTVKWNIEIKKLCDSMGAFYVQSFKYWGSDTNQTCSDFIHPNERGHKVIANAFWESFKQNVVSINEKSELHSYDDYFLNQNYPNPFNPTTRIQYDVPKTSKVTIKVYDIIGREITVLVNEVKEQGRYSAEFNARNLASGVYFYQINAGHYNSVMKMILIK